MDNTIPQIAKSENSVYFGILVLILLTISYYVFLKTYINYFVFKYGIYLLKYFEGPMTYFRNNFNIIISIWIFIFIIITLYLILPTLYKR